MKRSVIVLAVFCILIIGLVGGVIGANESDNSTTSSGVSFTSPEGFSESEMISKGRQCIENLLKDKKADEIGLDDAIFSTLAIGSKSNTKEKIESEEGADCWSKSGCKLKETSQVLLSGIGDKNNIINWISGKNSSVNGLNWFLQIDIQNHVPSECEIRYDTQTRTINILDDLTLSGNPGTCLEISANGFWLNVKKSCQDREYEISCKDGFVTSVLYQKSSGGAVYVSPKTQSSSGGGSTKEKVSGKCLVSGSGCDYEGSLWGAIALHKSGVGISDYIPYLTAFADDNTRYFPSAFLNILTGGDDFYGEIVQSQSSEGYWQMVGTPYNRFYDSGLGLLSLSGTNALELDAGKVYLGDVQGDDGCWNNNNIRDSGMVLWGLKGFGGISSGGGGGIVSCANAGYSCEGYNSCVDASGNVLNNYDCSSEGFGKVCCSVAVQEQSCSEKGGIVCTANQDCSGGTVSSSDGSCCLTACVDVTTSETECDLNEGACRFSCGDGEEEISLDCGTSSKVCCVSGGGGISLWWILIIIILIGLIALGIWKKDKLRMWLHKFKGRVKTEPVKRSPPREPPAYSSAIPFRQQIRRPARRDGEMEETLRKLREMAG